MINVRPELLEENFYESLKPENGPSDPIDFVSSVTQGGYYEIPSEVLRDKKVFDSNTEISLENNIFAEAKTDSPFDERKIEGDAKVEVNLLSKELSEDIAETENKAVYFYGFNVGQGDSLLLLTSNKSAYIIDGNFYNADRADQFLREVRRILVSHKMPLRKIKGLIVTHKHIDHLRGLRYILEKNCFDIDYFFINQNYHHPTKAVFELLNSAKAHIRKWVNVNQIFSWTEGRTKICVRNPDNTTCCRDNAPNINDSSISLCVRYKNNLFFLTGDSGYTVLRSKFFCHLIDRKRKSLLKVSHHGSDTGTDFAILNHLLPSHAFISAGQSKRYNHPHPPVVSLLENQVGTLNLRISKVIKKTVCYKADGRTTSVY